MIELRALQLRAHAHPKNDRTEGQIGLMMSSIGSLRQGHESGPLSAAAIQANRDLFNQAWGAIITLEVAKKAGGK